MLMWAIPPTVDAGLGCWSSLKCSFSPANIKGRYNYLCVFKVPKLDPHNTSDRKRSNKNILREAQLEIST